MSPSEQCYVGLKPCGCLGMVVMEREPRAPDMVAKAIRDGWTVERVPDEVARHMKTRCQAHTPPASQDQMPGMEDVAVRPNEGRKSWTG